MKSKIFLIILIVLEIAVASLVYVRFHEVAYNGDALYEAQVARNVLNGKGFVTSEMPLYAVDLYYNKGLSLDAPWVNTHKFVLPVYIKLLFIKVFGNSLTSVTFLYSYFFHLLSLLLIYVIALRLWPKNYLFAFLSSLVFLFNPVLGFGTPYIMLSGLNLTVDGFLFLLLLYLVLLWRAKGGGVLLFAAGLVSGAAFLDRYNSGLYIVVMFLVLAYMLIGRRSTTTSMGTAVKQFISKYLIYAGGFAVVVIPFLLWYAHLTNGTFLSINGLFQLLFDTKYNNFIDPWYKLDYIFPTGGSLGFALMHPLTLLVKWFKYASLDIVRFVAFENVLWWTPLVIVYFFIRKKDEYISRSLNFILWFVAGLAVIQVLILPLWAGSIPYFFYLFIPFSFVIAYAIYFLYSRGRNYLLLINHSFKDLIYKIIQTPLRNIISAFLFFSSISFLIYSSASILFQPLGVRGYLVILFTLCAVAGVSFVGYYRAKYIPLLFIVLGAAYFIAQTGVLTAPSTGEILRNRWDLEDNPHNMQTLESLNKGGVSLSITPWNTVWWSNDKLSSLPLPEYPDDIYMLEQKYNQHIDSLYLNKISLYPFKYISYPWSAYERAIQFGYGFDGFDVVQKTSQGIILGRNESQNPGMTPSINFGTQEGNSHLIWGWGENKKENNISYVSAGPYTYLQQTSNIVQGTRSDEKKISQEETVTPPDIVIPAQSGTDDWYIQPQSEVTFLSSSDHLSKAAITLRSSGKLVTMTAILNGNLLYTGQPGVYLGTFQIQSDWHTITIDLSSIPLNRGINKISFVFSGVFSQNNPTYADFNRVEFF